MKKLLKKGLAKVSESTNSWMITNGANSGISKMVGEALAESHCFSELVSIGILSLNRVACANELVQMAQQLDQPKQVST